MSEKMKREISLTVLLAAFMFLQFTVLALANHAGEGYLSTERRELVYYALQVFVILGFLAYAFLERIFSRKKYFLIVSLALLTAGSVILFFADKATPFYLIATLASMPCLGYLGGAVYHCMSIETAAGENTARSMGIGCAAAVALQFLLQIQWGIMPLLPAAMLAAIGLLAYFLLQGTAENRPGAQKTAEKTGPRRLLFSCLIAAAFLLLTGFYNGYIQH